MQQVLYNCLSLVPLILSVEFFFFLFCYFIFFANVTLRVRDTSSALNQESDTQRDLFAILIPSQKGFLPSLYHLLSLWYF